MRTFILFGIVVMLSACSATSDRKRSEIVGTAFYNGGTSTRTESAQKIARMKGANESSSVEVLKESRTADLAAVIEECKVRLERVSELRKQSNDNALIVSMIGLTAGSIIGPTLVATKASAGAIAFFSGIAGAANPLQSQLKERGYSPEAYAQRLVDINTAIKLHFLEFNQATDDTGRANAVLNLTADCLQKD